MDAQIRRALAHPKRAEILGYLMQKRGKRGTDETELAGSLDLARVEVKYHLTVLDHADLISRTDGLEPGTVGHYVAVASAGK